MKEIVIDKAEMDVLLADPELSKEKDFVIEKLALAHMIFDGSSKHALYSCLAAIICMFSHQLMFNGRHGLASILCTIPMIIAGLYAIYNVVILILCRKQMHDCGIYFRRVVELAIIKDCLREVQEEIQRRKDESVNEAD